MNTRVVGEGALLIDTQDALEAQQLRLAILRQPLKGLRELVPGLNSLLMEFDVADFDLQAFNRQLPKLLRSKKPAIEAREHVIEVDYDGEDLEAVSSLTGLNVQEVIQRHCAATYTVAFLGFAPGFPYLTGLDPKLRVARLKTPRTRVVAGAVAIAGEFAGIYPQATPGGWRILGHTSTRLFDAGNTPPALLAPGDHVRFRPQT